MSSSKGNLDPAPAKTSDESLSELKEKTEDDEKAGKKRGRPDDISSWETRPADGGTDNRQYDAEIASSSTDASKPEDSQVKFPEMTMKKSETEDNVTLSKEEYEKLKKTFEDSEKAKEDEKLAKAKQEQTDLIKSAVSEATADLREKLEKANVTIEKLASRPRQQKSISSVAVIEKGGYESTQSEQPQTFKKSEVLDVIEVLVKSKDLTMEQAIEYETTGTIVNSEARRKVERALKQ